MPRIVGGPVGGYRLFFISGGGIRSATSADGLNFTIEPGLRISMEQAELRDATGALQSLSGGSMVNLPDGRYRMYFSDLPVPGTTPGGHRVKSAVSTDMITWEVEPGIRLGAGAPVLTDTAEHPYALPHPDGSVTLYYGKFSTAPGFIEGTFFSTSTDGLTFTTETLAVFGGNDPDGIRRQDGTLLLYYGGFDPLIGGTVSVATCPDPAAPAAVAETPSTSTPAATSAPMSATITISNTGVSPNSVTIAVGGTVTFINNDSRAHDMSSDPHPQHSDCSAVNQAGFVAPGQSRTTAALTTARTCGFHDHDQPNNRNLQGTIIIQ
jgi:plastocyanin